MSNDEFAIQALKIFLAIIFGVAIIFALWHIWLIEKSIDTHIMELIKLWKL